MATLERFRGQARLQERMYEMTAALAKHYATDADCRLPPGALFGQLYGIVRRYVEQKVVASPPADVKDAFLSPYYGYLIERLLQHVRPDAEAGETPELPRYERLRGAGSTAEVDFWTRREPYPVVKSHLNAVVPDTKKFEQSAAWQLDRHPRVRAFAKNEGMGFGHSLPARRRGARIRTRLSDPPARRGPHRHPGDQGLRRDEGDQARGRGAVGRGGQRGRRIRPLAIRDGLEDRRGRPAPRRPLTGAGGPSPPVSSSLSLWSLSLSKGRNEP